jgi:ABC-type Fe2+-enterobactin transport system substrate-binding protein
MARDAFWGRVVFVLAIFALLIANTLAQRAHTRELLQNIDWARQHQSGLEDDVEMRLARIEAKLLSIEQRLPPPPQPSEVAKAGEPAARATPVANPPEPAAAPVQP